MNEKNLLEMLKMTYGEPFFRKGKKSVTLNQQFFVAYYAEIENPIYYLPEKQFYMYHAEKGIWECVTDEKMLNSLGLVLHQFADEVEEPLIECNRNASTLSALLKLLKGRVENKDAFSKCDREFVHCANCILEYDHSSNSWEEKEFSPEYYSRNQNPIKYDPVGQCGDFTKKLLKTAMTDDDIDHLQMYLGQCLLGKNLSQTFLLLIGTPGGGKSTLVNVIEGIVGRWNCTELRLEHMGSRFEISSARGKNLLTAKDVNSEFMSGPGAGKLKAITGNDIMTAELKSSNSRFDIQGNFNVIITSNATLRIKLDGDFEAWRRRILLIKYDKPKTNEVIVDFDKKLLTNEGSGILNWALEGAAKLLRNGGKIHKSVEQQKAINFLLQSSRPFEVFANNFIHPQLDSTITTKEVVTCFSKFCEKMKWPPVLERMTQKKFHEYMRIKHAAILRKNIKRNGRCKRGYAHFIIKQVVN